MASDVPTRRNLRGLFFLRVLLIAVLIVLVIHCGLNASYAENLIRPILPSLENQVFDVSPSRPLGQPGSSGPQFVGGSENIPFSSGMLKNWLPVIPNLQFGFNYLFGRNLRQSWWSADYVLPISITTSDIIFGEAHVDSANSSSTGGFPFLNNFWQQGSAGIQNRIDVSFGLGYRKFLGENVLVGAYGFYDSTRLSETWRSAGSVGFQAAVNGPGDSAIDLNFNYYSDSYVGYDSRGSVFPTFNLFGAIAEGRGNYDFEAGASQPLFDRSYDLRFKLAGYQYDMGNSKVYGLRSGADITTADGVFKVSAEYGNDRLTGQYGQVGAYINIGFRTDNIFKGENPFTKPEPIFRSPRNLRQFASQPAKRNWRKPSAVIANANCEGLPDDSLFDAGYGRACFYSGYADNDTGANYQCTHNGFTIISQTQGGILFNQYMAPYYSQRNQGILDNNRDVAPMDSCASAAFARQAQGNPVYVYVRCNKWANKTGGFWDTEYPILMENPNVKSLIAREEVCTDCANQTGCTWTTEHILK